MLIGKLDFQPKGEFSDRQFLEKTQKNKNCENSQGKLNEKICKFSSTKIYKKNPSSHPTHKNLLELQDWNGNVK